MDSLEEHSLVKVERWTEQDVKDVYYLYKKLNGTGLHKNNPELQKLAKKLNKSLHSIEAQAQVFKKIDTNNNTSIALNNKVSYRIWQQLELPEQEIIINTNTIDICEPEVKDAEANISNYEYWNKSLLHYYFSDSYKNQEVICFPVSADIFEEISDYRFTFDDFINSIKVQASSKTFFMKLQLLYEISLSREHNGRNIRNPIPQYFGFLIFLIYALSNNEDNEWSAANVYDRINTFAKKRLLDKWDNLDTKVSREILEPIWENLCDWSINFKKKKVGYFLLHDPKSVRGNRKYVSRLERHALLNNKQFIKIFDILINQGISVGTKLSIREWKNIFKQHTDKIPNGKKIFEYIKEDSNLQKTVILFLNHYYFNHYKGDLIASNDAKYKNPPILLRHCLESLPQWAGDEIEKVHYRAYSETLEQDILSNEIEIYHEINNFSNKLVLDSNLSENKLLSTGKYRYSFNTGLIWLEKNHELNEWIEVIEPTNSESFLLIAEPDIIEEIKNYAKDSYSEFSIKNQTKKVILLKKLEENIFKEVYKLYNPNQKLEGKIELISNFTNNRRKKIYPEFPFYFQYKGSLFNPKLFLKSIANDEEYQLSVSENDLTVFNLTNIKLEDEWYVYEKNTKIKSHYNYVLGNIEEAPVNVKKPPLRNHEGEILIEKFGETIFDLPQNFNRDYGISEFNAWHSSLYRIFRSKTFNRFNNQNSKYDSKHLGNALLNFLSLKKNISTRAFPSLVKDIDSSISHAFSKRILIQWRDLGYINFMNFGEPIRVNPTSMFFLSSEAGLKGYLTGFRNKMVLADITQQCNLLGIDILIDSHSKEDEGFYPQRILLHCPYNDLSKFIKLKERTGISFLNEIQNPLNPKYAVYQLICFFMQRSVTEFKDKLSERSKYQTDHHRKSVFDINNLFWRETTQRLNSLSDKSVVRFDGFSDRSITHLYKCEEGNVVLSDIALAIFASLKDNILWKRKSAKLGKFDLYIPLKIPLPYWIERGLVLLNARVPSLGKIEKKTYRIYQDVDKKILNVIEKKLNQTINEREL